MRFFLLIVLMLEMSAAGAAARKKATAKSCELSASRTAVVLSRLIQLGLEHQELTLQDVQRFVESADWTNPYESVPRSERTLSFRLSFDKASLRASEADQALVKKSVATLLVSTAAKVEAVSVARANTEQILLPKLLSQVEMPPGLDPDTSLFAQGWLDGRPIFVGRMRDATIPDHIFIFDPFNPLGIKQMPPTRVRGLPSDSVVSDFGILVKDDLPYAVDFKLNANLSLRDNKEVTKKFFSSPRRDRELDVVADVMIHTDRGPKIIATTRGGKFANKIMEFDPLNRKKPRVLASDVALSQHKPRAYTSLGKTYVAYSSLTEVYIYEASAGKIIDRFEINGSDKLENHVVLYSDRGKTKIAYFELDSDFKNHILRIRDLKGQTSSKAVYEMERSYDLFVSEIEGVNYLYFFNFSGLAMVNTQTGKVETHPLNLKESPSAWDWGHFHLFSWKDRKYLLWGTFNGDMKIFDLELRTLVFDQMIPVAVGRTCFYHFTTVHYQGHIYAVGTTLKDPAMFFQLTHGGGSNEAER